MKWRPVTWAIVTLVRAYKATLSPLFYGCCRFSPSCSTYCIEAVETHGPLRGGWLALRRLLRCHPFGPSGYDPVPGREERREREDGDGRSGK